MSSLVAVGALCATAVPASAQLSDATCRASAARVVAGAAVVAEPVVANAPGAPCSTQNARVAGVQPVGPLSVSSPQAGTRRDAGVVAASSSVVGVQLGGVVPVTVGEVRATQVVGCADGRPTTSGSSNVEALNVAGIPVQIIGDRPVDQTVAGVRIRANQVTGDTRRALVLDVAGVQVVLGEATAAGDACARAGGPGSLDGPSGPSRPGGPGGPGTQGRVCAEGSQYRVQDDVCVIEVRGDDGAVTRTIVVGKPYSGPTGGTLVALTEARRLAAAGKLESSACLRGKGPAYVVLGDAGVDEITGTNSADRIIGRGGSDRVSGGRGDDCIDGNAGHDRLSGSDGDDRMYGGPGNDKVNGDSGTDRLSGAAGNDTFNTAYGADRVFGGPGRDAVNAATSGPAAWISAGPGRDTVRINTNERRRVRGAERVFTMR